MWYRKNWSQLLCAGLLGFGPTQTGADGPPVESGNFRPPALVEVKKLHPGFRLDVRYATADNFLGRPVYPEAKVFLQEPAALALVRAQEKLEHLGFGLLIFDGYRPWSVTKIFWDAVAEDKKQFVADPSQGSRHNRGCAVDLSLYHLPTGAEVSMPSTYDEMTERAYPDFTGGSRESRRLRDLLRSIMESEGFSVYPTEWWHFDYKDWREYAILDLPFSAIHP